MRDTIPRDVLELIAAQARAADADAEARAHQRAQRQRQHEEDDRRRRALAEQLFAFTRALDAAVVLPAEGIELWARRSSRRGDELRVLPGGRVAYLAGSGPVPARIVADDASAAARSFGTVLLEALVTHVSAGAVWQHVRTTLGAPRE